MISLKQSDKMKIPIFVYGLYQFSISKLRITDNTKFFLVSCAKQEYNINIIVGQGMLRGVDYECNA